MKYLLLVMTLTAIAGSGSAQSRPAVTTEQLTVSLPAGKGETLWDNYGELALQLKERALRETHGLGGDPIARVDIDESPDWHGYLMISAMSPAHGTFYVVPLVKGMANLGSAPGKRITICRFELDVEALPAGFIAADRNALWSLKPEPSCAAPTEAPYRPVLDEQQQADLTSYRIYRRSDDGKAMIVSREDGGDMDARGGLQVGAGIGDPVSKAIVLPLPDWNGGYAETRAGRRFFYLLPEGSDSNHRTICIVEGVAWNRFASWPRAGADDELKRFCDEGIRAEQAASSERLHQRLSQILTPIQTQVVRPVD